MKYFLQFKREFYSYFFSPIAYAVIGASALLNGAMFFLIILLLSRSGMTTGTPMEMLFSWILFWVVELVLTPVITMRAFAEERHLGTFESLVTAPVNISIIVLAKYSSALLLYIIMWLPTLVYPLIISTYSILDIGPVISGYIGTFAIGGMLISIGIFASALTKNQIVAALLSFALIMILFLLGLFRYADWIPAADFFEQLDLIGHMEDFAKGIIDTRHLIYYATITIFALFGTVQVLESRRWMR
jgi:ABC-2 type transport system permease protein